MKNGKCISFLYEYRKRWGSGMTKGFYGRDLARYKLERAKDEHASDYDEFYIAGKEETLAQIQTSKNLINLVDKFLSEK